MARTAEEREELAIMLQKIYTREQLSELGRNMKIPLFEDPFQRMDLRMHLPRLDIACKQIASRLPDGDFSPFIRGYPPEKATMKKIRFFKGEYFEMDKDGKLTEVVRVARVPEENQDPDRVGDRQGLLKFLYSKPETLFNIGKELGVKYYRKYYTPRDVEEAFDDNPDETENAYYELARVLTKKDIKKLIEKYPIEADLKQIPEYRGRFYTYREETGPQLKCEWPEIRSLMEQFITSKESVGSQSLFVVKAIVNLGGQASLEHINDEARRLGANADDITPAVDELIRMRLLFKFDAGSGLKHAIPEELIPVLEDLTLEFRDPIAPKVDSAKNPGPSNASGPPPPAGPPATSSDTAQCPSCLKGINPDFKLCPYCGHNLKSKCPGCGKQIQQDFNLCPYCGEILK